MNWGKSIVVAFILFAGLVATMVTICVRQDVSLVTPNYYEQDLAYQKQIDRMTLTGTLERKPVISVEAGSLIAVQYDDFPKVQSGVLVLFRPSDASLDRRFRISPETSSVQYFKADSLPGGLYRARMTWTMEGQEYYLEQELKL